MEHLAAEVGKEATILLEQAVTSVEQGEGQGEVFVMTLGGRIIKYDNSQVAKSVKIVEKLG